MKPRLYDWSPSPFCLKVRAILDYKGVDYQRTNVFGKGIVDLYRRGKIGKVPAMDFEGELVCDSTDIALELERRYPEPAIVPSDPRDRGLCLAIEDWADEALYWIGIYYQWIEPGGRAKAATAFGKGPLGLAAHRFFERRIHRQVRAQGIGRKSPEHVRADLERVLDAACGLLDGREYVVDDRPRLADFALAAQLVYLSRTPVGGHAIETRPAIAAYTERMRALRRAADAREA